MKRTIREGGLCEMIVLLIGVLPTFGSDAETNAWASSARFGSGAAVATARYAGDLGFARTDTKTGTLNMARGVAVGLDEDGLSLSFSTALAPRLGPAFSTTFNMTIGSNGELAHSVGHSVATGGLERAVSAGGRSSSTRSGSTATAVAGGKTVGGGVVEARTASHHYRPGRVYYRTVHPVVRSR